MASSLQLWQTKTLWMVPATTKKQKRNVKGLGFRVLGSTIQTEALRGESKLVHRFRECWSESATTAYHSSQEPQCNMLESAWGKVPLQIHPTSSPSTLWQALSTDWTICQSPPLGKVLTSAYVATQLYSRIMQIVVWWRNGQTLLHEKIH